MAILNGKLDKMEFHFYDKPEMSGKPKKEMKVMYNPNSLALGFSNKFDPGEANGNGTTTQKFSTRQPRTLTMTLQFDGTGASPTTSVLGNLPNILSSLGGSKEEDINKRINDFLDSCYGVERDLHAPCYIHVIWGKVNFAGVLTSASITYKLFKQDGTPLRADVPITLLEHIETSVYDRKVNRLSPDLTKGYTVKEGDRLDALCEKFYNDPSLYHEVARVNNLKNPRKLTQGQQLIFPPIDKRN
jgi:hypothetical protein